METQTHRSKHVRAMLEWSAHGKADFSPLGAAPNVVAVPGDTPRNVRIDTTNGQEGSSILYAGVSGC